MIAILQYNAGNTTSVKHAVERLGYDCVITQDGKELRAAEKVIFPGVGEAGSAMRYLEQHGLDRLLKKLTRPLLGICLGQQLLCAQSEESHTRCLGIFDAAVRRFPATDIVPHMGWNSLLVTSETPLLANITPRDAVYFVHSYYCDISENTIAECDYIVPFSAAMQKDNYFATQFHPEKSGVVGERILQQFLCL